jgi:hypothetical protein
MRVRGARTTLCSGCRQPMVAGLKMEVSSRALKLEGDTLEGMMLHDDICADRIWLKMPQKDDVKKESYTLPWPL